MVINTDITRALGIKESYNVAIRYVYPADRSASRRPRR
jgi:hypothetical protein